MALFSRRVAATPAVPGPRRRPRTLLSRGQTLAAVIGLIATAALAVPASSASGSTSQDSQVTSSHKGTSSCNIIESWQSRAVEQHRVLNLLKDYRVLRSQADLDRLAAYNPQTGDYYFLLPHMFASMKGIGLTIVNGGVGGPGHPSLLFYKPTVKKSTNLTDAYGADFPYTLIGWGYVSPYTPGKVPTWSSDPGLRCLKTTDWLIHERSVHPSDTWLNIAVPPAEDYAGQVAGETPPTAEECSCPVGLNHGRFWDVHMWIGPLGVPSVSMSNPGKPIGGFAPGIGFFYPARVPSA